MNDPTAYDPNWVLDAVANGLIVLDAQQQVVTWNRWMAHHSGIAAGDARGRSLIASFPEVEHSRLQQGIDSALKHRMASLISPALHQPVLQLYQVAKDRTHDRRMQQLIHLMPMVVNGEPGCLLQVQDMTATVRRERRLRMHAGQLRASSYQDALTGLGNRRKFDESIREEFNRAQRNQSALSLIMIDIDHFKHYNDLYGHQIGDHCLGRVATIIRETLRQSGDSACRYGGEEFAILLPGTGEAGACLVAERLRMMVEAQFIRHETAAVTKKLTISLGVASMSKPAEQDSQTLIHAADMALYHAKSDGRNRSMCFSLETGKIRACL